MSGETTPEAFPSAGEDARAADVVEALTLIQTRKMRPIPVLLFGEGYRQRIVNFDAMVEEGAIGPEDLSIFRYVGAPNEAWEIIRDFYAKKEARTP